MHGRKFRPPPIALVPTASLVAMSIGDALAAAGEGWDAARATQGLIVLVGFALALLAGLVLLARTFSRVRAAPRIGVEELEQRLGGDGDLLLLDVRTAEDFVGEQGHIARAANIPLEVLESRLGELTADAGRPIAVICRTDRRSDRAAALLARRGFADVRVVEGGMTAWLRNGGPVEGARSS